MPRTEVTRRLISASAALVAASIAMEARAKVLKGNYERLFDAARVRVRAWEKANVK